MLRTLRNRIDALASDTGEYYVLCARTGEQPLPVAGRRFEDRLLAAAAARATEQYRRELAQRDPQAPLYDPIVCQASAAEAPPSGPSAPDQDPPLAIDGRPAAAGDGLRSFCHDVADAVFRALADRGHDAVEDAALAAYRDRAAEIADRNALCLYLLEVVATGLRRELPLDERVWVLRTAADRLPSAPGDDPVPASLDDLAARSLVTDYRIDARPVGDEGRWRIDLRGYPLGDREDALPTLPLTMALLRRRPGGVAISEAHRLAPFRWRITVATGPDYDERGLATVEP